MKLTDGLFLQIYNEIGEEYPEIEQDHLIVDIGAARLADEPENFDIVVTLNLYGDILSDITAQLTGSVGLGGSANIGERCAMFEAIHGSAPTIAGQNVANPSGLIHAAVMMMTHVGQPDVAERIHNAWLKTIEDGVHTPDIYTEGVSKERVGTKEFADAVVARLGQKPEKIKPVSYEGVPTQALEMPPYVRRVAKKETIGVDVFLDWSGGLPDDLGALLEPLAGDVFMLSMISNRGVKVWPNGFPETFCTDHWRCRFLSPDRKTPVSHAQIIELLGRVDAAGFDFIKTEHLCTFDGKEAFSKGQGE
jgi:isocitrate dehydrogenase